MHSTSRKYNIDRKSLQRLVKDIEKLKNVNNKKERKNLNGGGKKPYTIEIEEHLVELINKFREIEIVILTHELIIEAIKLLATLANNSYNANIMWVHRFLKKNGFSIRNITHTGLEIKHNLKNISNNYS